MARKPISKKLRFDVFKRDSFKCVYCGAVPGPDVLLEVDHVQPVAEGGENEIDNLVTACLTCNRGKGAEPLSVVPQSLEAKAAEVHEREAQIKAYHEILENKRNRHEAEMWHIAEMYMERFHEESILRTRLASIRMFLGKLDLYEVEEAMQIACDRQYSKGPAFKYFCGICWNKIRKAEGKE